MSPSLPTYGQNPDFISAAASTATRFETELEFVTMLTHPSYLQWLASNKYFTKPEFIAYLDYLQYWTKPAYVKYLTHPGPTLRILELLQQESFRRNATSQPVIESYVQALREGSVRR